MASLDSCQTLWDARDGDAARARRCEHCLATGPEWDERRLAYLCSGCTPTTDGDTEGTNDDAMA